MFLNQDLSEKEKSVPIIYWMPKMHYNPSRRRFIIASSTSSTNPISSVMSKLFKHIFNQIRNFNEKSHFYKNYNLFRVIENSKPFLEKIHEINKRNGAKDISTYDFSTLYTKLPHDDLISVLKKLVDFVFDCKGLLAEKRKKYITVTKNTTFWSKKKHGNNSFTKANINPTTPKVFLLTI